MAPAHRRKQRQPRVVRSQLRIDTPPDEDEQPAAADPLPVVPPLPDMTVVWFTETGAELGTRDRGFKFEPPWHGIHICRAKPVPRGAGQYRIEAKVRPMPPAEPAPEPPRLSDLLASVGAGDLLDLLIDHVGQDTLEEVRWRLCEVAQIELEGDVMGEVSQQGTVRIADHLREDGRWCRWSKYMTSRPDGWCPERCASITPQVVDPPEVPTPLVALGEAAVP